jgi:MoxR-like ATPase
MNNPELLRTEQIAPAQQRLQRLIGALNGIVFGREEITTAAALSLVCRGHMLFEGLPGLGKTELVRGLAGLLDLPFRRIQFTPDLMPSDITGSPLLEDHDGKRRLIFQPGPVFASVLLADEINRATPKTQSALLEAMQERSVTVLGETHLLPEPFVVLATQNPIDLEGTFPLPEAQVDRFLFKIQIGDAPAAVLERVLMERPTGTAPRLAAVMSRAELNEVIALVPRIVLPRAVANYIARLVAATHPNAEGAPGIVNQAVRFGGSPRAAIGLGLAARAWALLDGRPQAGFADVRQAAPLVLRHRLILQHAARLEGISSDAVIAELIKQVAEVGRPLPELAEVEGKK